MLRAAEPRSRAARMSRPFLFSLLLAASIAAASQAGAAGLASQAVQLKVPEGAAHQAPFDKPRSLNVPAGFGAELLARVPNARFLALAPNGDLLVSQPEQGSITLLVTNAQGRTQQVQFASGMRKPHDMVFHQLGDTVWLYVAEAHRIVRSRYQSGQKQMSQPEVVVDNLPSASSPELKGRYGHELKNIALAGDKLYVSIASTCNACESDTEADPVRGAIYEYPANGGKGRLYARGIRNAEGLAFRPGSGELWVVVNNRDNIAYPFHKDFNGDGSDDYGKVMQSYVDRNPPELLISVKDGGNYGWPFCNSNGEAGMDNMPYERDVQHNATGSKLDCSKLPRPAKGMSPHSAPLGMSFLPKAGMPASLAGGLAVALHGCWNCSALNGHKIVFYPIDAQGRVGEEADLVTGWLTDEKKRQRWGRPVDVIPDGKGGLYISDDEAGAVVRIKPAS
jgi:glucose/arabinose dehydrogenase